MSDRPALFRRLLGFAPFLFVLLFSFGLLFYTGSGDANRVYRNFFINKAASFGEIIQNPVNTYLLLGFPLIHYAGFETSTGPLLKAEASLERIAIRGESGTELFAVSQTGAAAQVIDESSFVPSALSKALTSAGREHPPRVFENSNWYKISFPLLSKLGVVGTLDVYASKAAADLRIFQTFLIPGIAGLGLLFLFALLGVLVFKKSGKGARLGIQVSFIAAFIILAGFIIFGLVGLYREGVGDKTEALTHSLAQRLDAAVALGIDLEDLTGIDGVFEDYLAVDPDIESIRLRRGDKTVLEARAAQKETAALSLNAGDMHLDVSLSGAGGEAGLFVTVGVPLDRIYEQLLRSGKNFIVLLVSCMFLSVLFLNILFTIRKKNETIEGEQAMEIDRDLKLDLIRPLYFLAVFLEGLFTSFLPQYFQRAAEQSGLGPEASSMLFTVYFIAFVCALLPTGKLAERGGVKWLLASGIVFCAASYVMLALVKSIPLIIASRILAGLGQGILFIAIQSYILRTASAKKKTQGSGIIVFGYNGGIISGTALGALLVTNLGEEGVFLLAAAASGLILLYTLLFVRRLERRPKVLRPAGKSPLRSFFRTWADLEFVRTIFFVGLVTKAVLTGVNCFALPLLLSRMHYLKEDIGQILIFYSAAVLVSTRLIAPLIDRLGKSRGFLFAGTQIGGLALYGLGFIAADFFGPNVMLRTILLIAAMLLLGFGHGFIHAPVVTHVANTLAARRSGVSNVTSLYRFLERMGHVAGPLVIGPLIYSMGMDNTFTLSLVGIVALAAGFLFFVGKGAVMPNLSPEEKEAVR